MRLSAYCALQSEIHDPPGETKEAKKQEFEAFQKARELELQAASAAKNAPNAEQGEDECKKGWLL